MKSFNVMALDANYQIVSLLRFTNLQWNRKYHQSGTFSIQIPVEQYSPSIKYIYTKNRCEMGKVTQINYINQTNYKCVQLSGYFLERELNRHIVFRIGSSNITNAPNWQEKRGKAEDVAYAFFNAFKTITTTGNRSDLGISAGATQSRGKYAVHTRNSEYLGDKIYDVLKPSGMSYRVNYDFVNSVKTFEVWSGTDRTDANEEGNNPIVFSTKFGNIKNPNILIETTEYKNACIIENAQISGDASVYVSRAVFGVEESEEIAFVRGSSTINKNDYSSEEFDLLLENEAANQIEKCPEVINVEFEALEGSYEYMVDFDLGDKCSVEIPEMNLSLQARLIGCYEVMKSGKWSMTMEFGTPIILQK